MEGKDLPQQIGQKKYNELVKTVSLMLRICIPIFGSRKNLVLDSGFCVSKGISDIEPKSVYAGYMIKNQSFWPKGVPGDLNDTHFEDN